MAEQNGHPYLHPEQKPWPWDDRGRSLIHPRKIAAEAEDARTLHAMYMARSDTRPLPHPVCQTVPTAYDA